MVLVWWWWFLFVFMCLYVASDFRFLKVFPSELHFYKVSVNPNICFPKTLAKFRSKYLSVLMTNGLCIVFFMRNCNVGQDV